jgi:hypothetical protein
VSVGMIPQNCGFVTCARRVAVYTFRWTSSWAQAARGESPRATEQRPMNGGLTVHLLCARRAYQALFRWIDLFVIGQVVRCGVSTEIDTLPRKVLIAEAAATNGGLARMGAV